MFGYVQANLNDLSEEEQTRYRAVYCGLCRTLGKRYGMWAQMGLTYDLTFLILLLSSLYEPEEQEGKLRCLPHPWKAHDYMTNRCTEYAADITVVLAYFKCLDDWQDERKLYGKLYAARLKTPYGKVKALWPEKCRAIEQSLAGLSQIETAKTPDPDAAAKCFGRLMEEIFVLEDDRWEKHLRALGNGLGRYIYLADAMVDRERDRKRGNYNPLAEMDVDPVTFRSTLTVILGQASQAFEELPLVQDIHLLRNILYSGLWIKFNQGTQPDRRKEKT